MYIAASVEARNAAAAVGAYSPRFGGIRHELPDAALTVGSDSARIQAALEYRHILQILRQIVRLVVPFGT